MDGWRGAKRLSRVDLVLIYVRVEHIYFLVIAVGVNEMSEGKSEIHQETTLKFWESMPDFEISAADLLFSCHFN